jgi:hypothetical protein
MLLSYRENFKLTNSIEQRLLEKLRVTQPVKRFSAFYEHRENFK